LYPNLYALTRKGYYTGNAVSDANDLAITTYADALTGVRRPKHGVTGTGPNHLNAYPSFLTNAELHTTDIKTAGFVRAGFIYDSLLANVDEKQKLSSDAAVADAAVAALANTQTNVDVLLTQFTAADEAGATFGYGPDVPQYLLALQEIDGYIGKLMKAVKARPSYTAENWLICVVSNKGGPYTLLSGEDDGSDFSDTRRNAFVLIYNDRFVPQYFPKPDLFNYVWSGYTVGNASGWLGELALRGNIGATDADVYNISTDLTKEYTIQFKANISSGGTAANGQIPGIFAKTAAANGASPTTGWNFILNAVTPSNWSFRMGGATLNGPAYNLNVWTTFTARIYYVGGKRWIKCYTNGTTTGGADSSDFSSRSGNTVSNLMIGCTPSYAAGSHRLKMADIRIYNTALPDAYIRNEYCRTLVNPGDPYYQNLIGYWPGFGTTDERNQNILMDKSPSKRNIVFPTTAVWTGAAISKTATTCPTVPADLIDQQYATYDLPLFILKWIGASDIGSLNLDSKLVSPTYGN
jgi:hypothetical protein